MSIGPGFHPKSPTRLIYLLFPKLKRIWWHNTDICEKLISNEMSSQLTELNESLKFQPLHSVIKFTAQDKLCIAEQANIWFL